MCAGLKRRFVDQGGSASAFELGKDVCEARYELKACEQKRLAERERAEQLARELEKARRALASLEANGTLKPSNALAARGANANYLVTSRNLDAVVSLAADGSGVQWVLAADPAAIRERSEMSMRAESK